MIGAPSLKNVSYVLAFLLAVSASASAQTGVEGTWQAQPRPGQTWTMVLIVDGAAGGPDTVGLLRRAPITAGKPATDTRSDNCE